MCEGCDQAEKYLIQFKTDLANFMKRVNYLANKDIVFRHSVNEFFDQYPDVKNNISDDDNKYYIVS